MSALLLAIVNFLKVPQMLKIQETITPHDSPVLRDAEETRVSPSIPSLVHTVPPSHHLRVIVRRRWQILAFTVGAVAVTWAVSGHLTPIYESTATILIETTGAAARPMSGDADSFFATQTHIAQSESVLAPVVEQLKTREHRASVGGTDGLNQSLLRVTRLPGTNLLQVSYRSPDRQLAAHVANSVVRSYHLHVLFELLRKHLEHSEAALSTALWLPAERADEFVLGRQPGQAARSGHGLTSSTGASPGPKNAKSALTSTEIGGGRLQPQINGAPSISKTFAESKTYLDRLKAELSALETQTPEATVNARSYEDIVRNLKELSIAAGFTNDGFSMVNRAMPSTDPVFPRIKFNLVFAFLFSAVFALGCALLNDAMGNVTQAASHGQTGSSRSRSDLPAD